MSQRKAPTGAVGATFRLPDGAALSSNRPVRKRIRLARETYDGQRACSITITTHDRHPAFRDELACREATYALNDACRTHSMRVLAYCFMPDHAHLLLVGGPPSNLIDFTKRFKQLSGFGYKQRTGKQLWQKGYFDHILRAEEALEDVADYIFGNPVVGGLVSEPGAYPFSGGEYFEQMLGRQPEGSPHMEGAIP